MFKKLNWPKALNYKLLRNLVKLLNSNLTKHLSFNFNEESLEEKNEINIMECKRNKSLCTKRFC